MKQRLLQVFIWTIITTYSLLGQCIVCKSSVENARQESMEGLAKGINMGILYLLPIPYLLVGGIGLWWYWNYRKKNKI